MDTRSGATGRRSYEDFQPKSEWVQGDGLDTLRLNLPGFKKEQLRVQVDNANNMKITGERPLDDNKWSRFRKDVRIPDDYNLSALRAKFEGGNLNIIMPKATTKPPDQQQKPISEAPPTQKPAAEPKYDKPLEDTNQKVTPAAPADKQTSGKSSEPTDPDKVAKTPQKKQLYEATSVADAALKFANHDVGTDDAGAGGYTPDKSKQGVVELVMGLYRPSKLKVNIVVASLVVAALAVYVTYKMKSTGREEN